MEVTNDAELMGNTESPLRRRYRRQLKGCICVTLLGTCLLVAGLTMRGGSPDGGLNALELDRQAQVKAYMAARVQANQGQKKAEGVDQVLDCFSPDKAVLDIQYPEAERIEGKTQIKKYLEDGGSSSSVIEDLGSNVVPTFDINGKLAVQFVMKKDGKAKANRLLATFEFKEGTALIQKVTVVEDTSKPLTELDKERQQMVRKYMVGRIEAFQGKDKAHGVQQVLECFMPDTPQVKPTIDLKAPKAELAVGLDGIKHYLENPPKVPCAFKEGSTTDPVMVDGKAEIKFTLKVLWMDNRLQATYEFEEGSARIRKVTVVKAK